LKSEKNVKYVFSNIGREQLLLLLDRIIIMSKSQSVTEIPEILSASAAAAAGERCATRALPGDAAVAKRPTCGHNALRTRTTWRGRSSYSL